MAIQNLIFGGGTASAGFVVYNTGVYDNGQPLGSGELDTHYTVSRGSYTGGTNLDVGHNNTVLSAYAVDNPDGLGWSGNTTNSAWISPDASGNGDPGIFDFIYTTQFDLTGINLATFSFYGNFYSDDGATAYFNGNLVADNHYTGFNQPWKNPGGVFIHSGFQNGINTLQFVTPNASGAGGLRFEVIFFNGLGNSLTVPEPSSLSLVASAAATALIAGAIRKRRRQLAG